MTLFLISLDTELLLLELLHSNKVPNIDSQLGGAVSTRGMKRVADEGESKQDVKMAKPEAVDPVTDTTNEYGGGADPLYVADS